MTRSIVPPEPPAHIGENNLAKDRYRRPDRLLQHPDAIVIGSGIGGLGVASLLAQRKGMRVLVLEAAPIPGGSCRCYEWDGFEFNTGIDSIGDMDPAVGLGFYRPTIDYMTGGHLKWAKMPEVHEVVRFGEDTYEWYSSPEKNVAWVEERFPGEGHKAQAYYDLEARIMRWAPAMGVTKVLPERMPESLRLQLYLSGGGPWTRYLQKSTTDVLRDELGMSDKLASVFSYIYGYHGRTPAKAPFAFHAGTLYHYRWGAYYPVGGPAYIAECIVPIVERAGGQVAVRSPVERIVVEDDTATGVQLASGETIMAPLVISDVGAYGTFMELIPPDVSQRHGYPERFEQVRPSVAHLYLFLGYDEAIELPKQIFWELPSYDIEGYDAGYKQRMDFEHCMGGYCLSPSARDPVFQERFPGKSTVIALNEVPHEWVARSRTDPQFRKEVERAAAKYLLRAVHVHMPQLRDKTPAFQRAGLPFGCNPRAWKSCSLGIEPSPERFLKHTHWLRPQTKIRNLFLTGQDAFAMGFSSAMFAARLCYSALTNNWAFCLRKTIGRFP